MTMHFLKIIPKKVIFDFVVVYCLFFIVAIDVYLYLWSNAHVHYIFLLHDNYI